MKAESKTPEERNTSKINILKDWGKGIYNFLKEIPFVGAMIKMGEGTIELISGLSSNNTQSVINSLKTLKQTPLSFISDALLPIMDATMSTDSSGTQKINFDKMKQMIGKQVLNWFPSWMRGAAAYVFGLGEEPTEQPQPQSQNQPKQPEQPEPQTQTQSQNQEQAKPKTRAEAARQRDQNALNKKQNDNIEDVENKQSWTPIHDNKPIQKMNDGLLESTEPIQMKLGNSIYETAPNDSVLAFKPGGMLDLALKDITVAIKDINNNIQLLNKNILLTSNEKSNTPSVINVNNSSVNSNPNSGKEYLFNSVRDVISNSRSSWWLTSEQRSAVVG
jgi:hypothetical protein